MENIRVAVDRPNGRAVWVSIPEKYSDEFQEKIIEYAKAMHFYYSGGI